MSGIFFVLNVDSVNIAGYNVCIKGILLTVKGQNMSDKSYHHPNLREALIEAGIRLMNQGGYEKLSLREIAKQCDVSHTAPYRHFEGKDDLLRAMREYVEQQFVGILENAITEEDGEVTSMTEFGKAYVKFFAENPQYFTFFTKQDDIYVNISVKTGEMESNYRPFMIFREQACKFLTYHGVPPQMHLQQVMAMWAMVHGLAGTAMINGVHFDGDWAELTEQILKAT